MHRAGLRRRGGGELPDDAWQNLTGHPRRQGFVQGHPLPLRHHALPLTRRETRVSAGLSGGHCGNRRGGNYGTAPQGAAHLGRAVSSREHPHRARPHDDAEFFGPDGLAAVAKHLAKRQPLIGNSQARSITARRPSTAIAVIMHDTLRIDS